MLLLAFDTSTPTARVAVVDATGTVRARAEATAARHSGNLLRLVDAALREAGGSVADLGGVACGRGPGSFTGLRVGLAVAKGLGLARDLPLVTVSSLEALALDLAAVARDAALLVPCIDAGKGQIHVARFQRSGAGVERAGPDELVAPELLGSHLDGVGAAVVGGPGAELHRAVLLRTLPAKATAAPSVRLVEVSGPSADAVARLALPRLQSGDFDDLAAAVPAYGRAPDITKPRKKGPPA